MLAFKNFFSGRVNFEVTGLPIACLNKLKNFKITNVKFCEDTIFFSVPLVHALTVKRLVSNFDWKMKENFNIFRGMNFLLSRFVLSISVLLCMTAYFIFDMGIYNVKVISNDIELAGEVYTHLESLGVKKFISKSKVNDLNLASDLVSTFSNVAHANIRISGNTLIVSVLEASNNVQKQKVNIYSHYDAVIKQVIVFSGKSVVEVGDVVKKGDLLVENAYDGSVAIIGEVAYFYQDRIVRLNICLS